MFYSAVTSLVIRQCFQIEYAEEGQQLFQLCHDIKLLTAGKFFIFGLSLTIIQTLNPFKIHLRSSVEYIFLNSADIRI